MKIHRVEIVRSHYLNQLVRRQVFVAPDAFGHFENFLCSDKQILLIQGMKVTPAREKTHLQSVIMYMSLPLNTSFLHRYTHKTTAETERGSSIDLKARLSLSHSPRCFD